MLSSRSLYQVLLLVLFLAAVVGAVFLLVRHSASPGVEIVLPTPTPTPLLKVYVSGAVANPGVYTMEPGDRVQEAVQAAGGPSQDADTSMLNLARRLRDEDHVHVPRIGETVAAPTPASVTTRININTASAEVLDTLPGVGPATASAIVEYREQNGGFRSVQDLLKVRGIGPVTYQLIRDLVTVEEP